MDDVLEGVVPDPHRRMELDQVEVPSRARHPARRGPRARAVEASPRAVRGEDHVEPLAVEEHGSVVNG
jgi:hypothetical protein